VTWNEIVTGAEALASLAVVVSLVYLAIQVRLQSRESRISVVHSLTEQWGEAVQAFATHADLYAIWIKGLMDFECLTPEERGRFSAILINLSQIFESLHLHHREGRVDPELWDAFENRLRDVFATPGAQCWWAHRRHWHTQRFQAHVDRAIAKSHETAGRYVAIYGKAFAADSASEPKASGATVGTATTIDGPAPVTANAQPTPVRVAS
jgi:hypothetical protein